MVLLTRETNFCFPFPFAANKEKFCRFRIPNAANKLNPLTTNAKSCSDLAEIFSVASFIY
jgi:hypothetical protein